MKNPYRLPNPGKTPQYQEPEKTVTWDEFLAAQSELDELRKQHGIEPEQGKVSKAVSQFFDRRDARQMVKVNKKVDTWLCILLGWAGGHRFYQKQYLMGLLYLALCWTGFSMAMSIVDLLIILPKKADEDGCILM